MQTVKLRGERFHGFLDSELRSSQVQGVGTTETKYLIIQERDVRYRFYLHQHPYVKNLVQRLIREGIPGLQAADTAYAEDKASLPNSIEISIPDNKKIPITIPAGSTVKLLADAKATLADSKNASEDNVSVDLTANMNFRTARSVSARLSEGMKATLLADMTETPYPGTDFTPADNSDAIVSVDTKVELIGPTAITLHDGSQATLQSAARVALSGGSSITLPNGIQVKLLKSRPVPELYEDFFETVYAPDTAQVQRPYPVKDLDFTTSGAYSAYNWELFFHVPFTIAVHLSKNQRFAEAQRWFHYLFDPTDDSDGPTPERFWKVRPFHTTDVKKIGEILVNLVTGADETLRSETIRSIDAWKDAPFRPHVIARYRQQSYMYKTVMAYLDNLIAWGDSLFRQDTGEAIDEALQLYVLAANILGPRPQPVPKKGSVRPQTYANLRQDLRQFGTVVRDFESILPIASMPFPTDSAGDTDRLATLRSLGKALYFCVPRNDKLLSYWDTVADRLFKIRNSLNLQGIFRQLALFEPPIDPAMLARAAAAGLDVAAIVSGMNQPLPLVRFTLLIQKAAEIAQEVKSLGNNLLAAMEKEDNEALAILRARHERAVMEMVEHVKYGQLQEAIKSKEGLLQSLALALQRYTYYERQLGKKMDEIEQSVPELEELDRDSLKKMKFAMQEPEVALREIEVDIAQDLSESGGKILSSYEVSELIQLGFARNRYNSAANYDLLGTFLSLLPEIGAQAQPLGAGAAIKFGGMNLATQMSMTASSERVIGDQLTYEAGKSSKIGSYARRQQEWAFNSNLAADEVSQTFKQIRAAQIREAIAEQELKNHRQQMKHAEEIERFLNEEGAEKSGKHSNKAFYTWMKREVKGLYSQCFQFAFDIAKKAERALQHELGDPDLNFVKFGYLSGKEGLMAGEKLYLDVKRMELAYHDLNQREYELTKHISLQQIDPRALIQLRTTGSCTVYLPEVLFDMDGPGHYFRRIKNVAVSIPCVTGPYASVNCKLTLLKSSIRKTAAMDEGEYQRVDAEDERFSDYFGGLQSIVTSAAQNDSGLFETNLRDERYLPFENSGVISEWQLALPANPTKKEPTLFDYETISDVILHMRYTAREGGDLLRSQAITNIEELIDTETAGAVPGSISLFSARHEFPTEWAKFQNQDKLESQRFGLTLNLRKEHYPFWSQGRLKNVAAVDIWVKSTDDPVPGSVDVFGRKDVSVDTDADDNAKSGTLNKDTALGNFLVGSLEDNRLPGSPIGEFKFFFDTKAIKVISDLWFAVTWSA